MAEDDAGFYGDDSADFEDAGSASRGRLRAVLGILAAVVLPGAAVAGFFLLGDSSGSPGGDGSPGTPGPGGSGLTARVSGPAKPVVSRPCGTPVTVRFVATLEAKNTPATVTYRWVDGEERAGPKEHAELPAGTRRTTLVHELTQTKPGRATVRLEFISPVGLEPKHAAAKVICTGQSTTPPPTSDKPPRVPVPGVIGNTVEEAKATLDQAGLSVRIREADGGTEGTVTGHYPSAGENVAKGTVVELTVSRGEQPSDMITMPDLRGRTVEDASAALAAAGWTGEPSVSEVPSDPGSAGRVVSHQPATGTEITATDPVTLSVGAAEGEPVGTATPGSP